MNSKINKVLILLIIIVAVLFASLSVYKFVIYEDGDKNKDNETANENFGNDLEKEDSNNDLKYEIKDNNGIKELYVNDKKIEEITTEDETGNIVVKELKDSFIVILSDTRLFSIDKDNSVIEYNYVMQEYSNEFIDSISLVNIEDDSLYLTIERKLKEGTNNWYCEYKDKKVIIEYEIKYTYSDNSLKNKDLIKELSIEDKYNDGSC